MKQRFVFWYAARVKYRTEKKIKQYLEKEGIEHYIPLQEEKPLLPCTVFIHTDHERALSLPVECGCMMDYLYNADTRKLRTVPDKQIEDFMFLQDFSDRTILLTHPEDLKGVHLLKSDIHDEKMVTSMIEDLFFDAVIDCICYTEKDLKYSFNLFKKQNKTICFYIVMCCLQYVDL
jgi:hypothetical protein